MMMLSIETFIQRFLDLVVMFVWKKCDTATPKYCLDLKKFRTSNNVVIRQQRLIGNPITA